jgi:hypothetical protein
MPEIDSKSPEGQTALAMAALAVAVADALQELVPDGDALATLQRKAVVAHARLRRTPNAQIAVAIFRFVREALYNPDVIEQPED